LLIIVLTVENKEEEYAGRASCRKDTVPATLDAVAAVDLQGATNDRSIMVVVTILLFHQ
jgi:hypothetical protein